MPTYVALHYCEEIDWTAPDTFDDAMQAYGEFEQAAGDVIRGGAALYPTATATTVRVPAARAATSLTSDGPYAETKEALTGFYLLECADLDEAIAVAAKIPAAWDGAVEVRPVIASCEHARGARPGDAARWPRLVRDEGGRVLAILVRVTRRPGCSPRTPCRTPSSRALETWPRDGVPDNPRAWLLATARRRAIDLHPPGGRPAHGRSDRGGLRRTELGPSSAPSESWSGTTCCGWSSPAATPALPSTPGWRWRCARSCGLHHRRGGPGAAGAARRRWPSASPGPSRRSPWPTSRTGCRRPHELPGPPAGGAATVYLMFNEGYAAGAGDELVRADAVPTRRSGSARLLRRPDAGRARARACSPCCCCSDARRAARVDGDGALVLLADQDRTRWDHDAIAEGVVLVGGACGARRTGPTLRHPGRDRRLPRPRPDRGRHRLGRHRVLVRRPAHGATRRRSCA